MRLKKTKINNNWMTALTVLTVTLLIQSLVTWFGTNGQEFSFRALIRNLSITLSIAFAWIYKNGFILLIPLFVEAFIEILKYNGIQMEKYIATKYQYNDYWFEINKIDPIFSNFSEANYDGMFNIDTKDMRKVDQWCRQVFERSQVDHTPFLGDPWAIKKRSDDQKFALFCEKCQIRPGMRVLEIGFGQGDLLMYLREHHQLDPVGISISKEQVELVRSKGFEAHTMDAWDMTPEAVGTFDLIIQCGNLEYFRCWGEPDEKYEEFARVVGRMLNPTGKYFITCIHFNERYLTRKETWPMHLYHKTMAYLLWSGNDGGYPEGSDGFTKWAQKAGLKTVYQEDRTSEYYIATTLFMSYLRCYQGRAEFQVDLLGILSAVIKTIAAPYYLHTYLCYTPAGSIDWIPWQWEFIPQHLDGRFETPVTLQYILMEKDS